MADIDELIKTHTEKLSPLELTTLTSLIQDFTCDKIGKTELTRSLRRLFGLDDNHQDPKIDDKPEDKKLTSYEEDMNICKDCMYQTDMLMETLRSAVENAEKVMRGEMRMEDIGVNFYRCAEQLYGGDMFEDFDLVRENNQRALPLILNRLNQKLLEVTAFRESYKPTKKQAIKKISVKQKDSTAQRHMKK